MNSQPFEAKATETRTPSRYASPAKSTTPPRSRSSTLHELVNESQGELRLDLDNVTFLDSEGLKMLLALFDQARRIIASRE